MPKVNGIGYGEFTPIKIDHFSKIAKAHLLITQAVLNRNSGYYPQNYHYIDLTAGCGQTPNGEKGCAITFVQQAESDNITINSTMSFFECDQGKLDELKHELEKQKLENRWRKSSWNFYCGKYEELIPNLINSKTKDFGLFFIDPSGELPDFDILKHLSIVRPKMEILIYLPSTNVKEYFNIQIKN